MTRERLLTQLKKATAEDLEEVFDELIWRATMIAEIGRRMRWLNMRELKDALAATEESDEPA